MILVFYPVFNLISKFPPISDDLPDRNCEKCIHCCIDYAGWLKFQNALYKVCPRDFKINLKNNES